ncbi:hypothetical protein O3M35_003173 [Rhynocoris fuscipes]|uniref:Uncharacterized protein n=1 Tax=Rhynocoris fuscipes TaxID=488301 RepID=A0AAW1CJG0_9HEMI
MMWPGSNFEYSGINATYITKYNHSIPWKDRVDTVISWFDNKVKPANLVMMYFEEPDRDSHAYGPDSPQTNVQIQRVDKIVKYISDQLNDRRFKDLNVIFLSDHGMEGVTINRIIDLRPIVGNISDMYGTSPVLQVYPKKGKEEEVYMKLKSFSTQNKHFHVYKQKDIPDEFHYKKCSRSPPILVLAEPKYAFHDLYDGIKWYKNHYSDVTDNNTFGVHGYDPKTIVMHPYFIAYGPSFKDNYEADHLYTVDMYILFANLLSLNPVYTDGDINRVLQVLEKASLNMAAITVSIVMLLISFGIIIFSVVYIKRKRKKLPIIVTETIFDEREGVALLEQ